MSGSVICIYQILYINQIITRFKMADFLLGLAHGKSGDVMC